MVAESPAVLRQEIIESHNNLCQERSRGFQEVNLVMEQMRLETEPTRSEISIIRCDLQQKVGRHKVAVPEAPVAKLEQVVRER